jgi:hypothetical protein
VRPGSASLIDRFAVQGKSEAGSRELHQMPGRDAGDVAIVLCRHLDPDIPGGSARKPEKQRNHGKPEPTALLHPHLPRDHTPGRDVVSQRHVLHQRLRLGVDDRHGVGTRAVDEEMLAVAREVPGVRPAA